MIFPVLAMDHLKTCRIRLARNLPGDLVGSRAHDQIACELEWSELTHSQPWLEGNVESWQRKLAARLSSKPRSCLDLPTELSIEEQGCRWAPRLRYLWPTTWALGC